MRSVADIPPGDDADDELSGISPELVLVDPDLARLVREREPAPPAAPPKRTPTLRLVPIEETEPPIVPRPAEATRPTAGGPAVAPPAAPPAPAVEIRPETPAPAALTDPPASPAPALPAPAVEPATEAQPAWLSEPAPVAPAEPAEPEPLPESRPAAIAPAMPHPVARPATVTRQARPPRAPRSRGRGVLALVAAIAVASLAVLGITRFDGGLPFGSSGSGQATAVPPGTPPTAKTAVGSKSKAGAASKPAAKLKATGKTKSSPSKAKTTAKTKSSPSKAKTTAKTKSSPSKAKTTAAKAKASRQTKPSTTKPKASTTPKQAATKPKPKSSGTTAPAVAPEPRRFAWAPVAGAIGYHVELFKGANRVLEKETTEPVLEIGPSWQYEGRTSRLTPGSYRWYVWPVSKSGRSTQAVVQATLDVP